MATYKPENYNSLSPYLIVDDAQKLIDLLIFIFERKILRRFEHENGKIAHIELMLDDTIIMISDSTKDYPPNKSMLHIYVPNVLKTYKKAIGSGCIEIEKPSNNSNDPDLIDSFYDIAGNYWAVSTQTK